MKKTELLQEIRKMKFEEISKLRTEKRISVEDAASMLGMSTRNLRRYVTRYNEEGIDGLLDKRLAKAAHNAVPVDEAMALTDLYQKSYVDYSAAHFFDKYRQRHQGKRCYNWVRLSLQKKGVIDVGKKKGQYRCKRPRRPMVGMMIHQDASSHEWVEGQHWDLVVTLDDATNEIYSAFFVEEEGTFSSFKGVKEVIEAKGLFCSFYSDRGSHYWTTVKEGKKVDKVHLTQFGRAMQQLGIQMIAAYSPQARGRSERMFGTLQKRLPLELKSAGITTMDEANRFLNEQFLPEFNKRFRVKPQEEQSAFTPWTTTHIKLDDILCIQEERTVNKDNTVSYRKKKWQLPKDSCRYSYAKAKVKVHEHMDGSIAIFYGPRELARFEGEIKATVRTPMDLWMSLSEQSKGSGTSGDADGKHGMLSSSLACSLTSCSQNSQPQEQGLES